MLHFIRSMPFSTPKLIPMAIQDWIVGLSMQDYANRHFIQEFEKGNSLTRTYLNLLENSFKNYLNQGALEMSMNQVKDTAANLSISMKGLLDRDFFIRVSYHLKRILQETTSSVTLHIEEFQETRLHNLNRLLRRLSPYGDRIHIKVNSKLRNIVNIDSSIFHLVLDKDMGQFAFAIVPVKKQTMPF